MGCHTWGYIKLSSLPQEATEEFIKEINDTINEELSELTSFDEFYESEKNDAQIYIEHYIANGNEQAATEWKEYVNIDNVKRRFVARIDRVRPFRNGVNEQNLVNATKDFGDSCSVKVINNNIYVELGCDCLPIRISRYPEETFIDMDALREFIISESQKGNVSIIKDCSLAKITSENLNECLQLFDDFVNKHGKYNLYFEFG